VKRRIPVRLFFFAAAHQVYKIQDWPFALQQGIRGFCHVSLNVSITVYFQLFFSWHNVYQTCRTSEPQEVAMQVGDVLRKKAARVATVRMNETVAIAARLMRAANISALVVKDVVRTEGNTAVGMFTERDVVRAIAEHGAAGVSMRVSQFISVQQLVSCSSSDSLEHVRRLMNKHHIRHVPVIDNYSLIGVISIRDISKAFDEQAMPAREPVPA